MQSYCLCDAGIVDFEGVLTCFLVVVLDTLREVVVDDKAHIWLVDAHAKCHRGHADLHLAYPPAQPISGFPHATSSKSRCQTQIRQTQAPLLRKGAVNGAA